MGWIAVSSNAVKIQQHGALAGFAYAYTKEYRVSAEDGSFEIVYEIKNCGRTEIVINHYNHHWFKLGELRSTPVAPASVPKEAKRGTGIEFGIPAFACSGM